MMRNAVHSPSRERGFALLAWAAVCGLLWLTAANALAYDIVNRWSSTQIDGGGLQRGDPVTLRWSVVPDGGSYSRSNNSELVDFLDAAWGVRPGPRRFDFTSRPWWTVIDNAYAQYSRVSGISLEYVPELTLEGTSTGLFGDIRIGGEIIDGTPGGTLADNTFPNSGDMRIDTSRGSDGSIGSYFRTEPGLRNLVIHETGHGVGLGHTEFVNNSAKAVMEGGLRTDIWGLQFDDVYALNRQYGDPRERDGGNDNAITASILGDFGTAGSVSIGADATDSVVEQFDDDWVGIDGTNDLDWYRFSVIDECFANILLTPVGSTYTTVAQGLINAAAMSDLNLQLFRDGPRLTRVTTVDQHGIGGAEWIPAQLLSKVGDYLIRIAGEQDFNQFYQLDVLVGETPVAGTSADLNLDGMADLADWHIFLASDMIDLAGLTPKELFQHGDLDLDGDNDELDLDLFRTAYDLANGAGAFDTLPQIPEPAAISLTIMAFAAAIAFRRRMSPSPFNPLRSAQKVVLALLTCLLAWTLAEPAEAHLGRRLRIDVVDGKLVARGVNTGEPDGASDVRDFTGAVHDHWRNFHLPQLPTPDFAQTFLPEFDIQPTVTSLHNHSLSLRLVEALQWAHPQLAHHGGTTPQLTPLDPGELIRIEGAANTSTTTDALGSLLLLESVPAGGDPDIGVLYSIDGHPQDEIHVLEFTLLATNLGGPTMIAPSDPIYVLLAPDGDNAAEKLHHAALFLSEYLGTAVPEPTTCALAALGFILFAGIRRQKSHERNMRTFKNISICLLTLLTLLSLGGRTVAAPTDSSALRPPATPLVACDPYFSIWSQGKSIADCDTTHWTGKPHRLVSLIRVDGKTYRLLGNSPSELPAFAQLSQQVLPTRSIILMSGAGVEVTLTFTTPALPADIDLLSRPITYVSYDLRAADGKSHEVQLIFAASGENVVDQPDEQVSAENVSQDSDTILRVGSVEQNVLGRKGDDLRIDWGYLYLAARSSLVERASVVAADEFFKLVEAGTPLPEMNLEEAVAGGDVVLAVAFKPVTLRSELVDQWLLLAYDDLYSIEFMQCHLQPYWRRNGLDGPGLVQESLRDYESLMAECESFDGELVDDLRAAGGPEYADIACLAYRQCFAAGKFVADANGQPLQFSKENHSNGCIGTSDVFYPMAPQFLLFGPSLAKSFVVPFMEYAESDRWKFPFAPHDLGTYPKANGQVYGGGETSEENQMPVEECGNMLLLMGAIAKVEGNADFAARYWTTLVRWAEYLKDAGFDPESQLCTDDFAGHMAHNVNLSAKAICALGAFAQLCEMRGEHEIAQEYRQQAESFASRWMKEADDGDHYRLAFDKPGTWSQKYNLVWDRVLGLGLFPDSVLRREMDYYKKVQNRYGLPLDNRREYTKLDWVLWTATLTENPADFQALVSPVHRFLNDTPDRSPMTDWYETKSGKKVGFTARPVVGSVFMRMLYDDEVWKKWAERDRTAADGYADLPKPPTVRVLVAAADTAPASWRYTTEKPSGDWQSPEYDDSTWREGAAGFGTGETPGAEVGTVWNTPDIWLRRKFDVSEDANDRWRLRMHHDEDAEVYINGVPAQRARGYTSNYEGYSISKAALAAIKPSGNVFAVHCHQTGGGQYIDVGIVTLDPADDGWISLFNGKDLTGWKASEHSDSFRVVDSELVIKGPRSHLFYTGPVGGADFTNFEWKCEVLTKPSSNSGMYFHTEYQEDGWPAKGYEVQINNSHSDPKRTGGLYAVADVMHDSPVKDNEWFTEQVTVEGKHVVVSVNGQVTTDYTEPNDVQREPDFAGRKLSHGTIALQAHDPGSEVRIRKIMIKPLP